MKVARHADDSRKFNGEFVSAVQAEYLQPTISPIGDHKLGGRMPCVDPQAVSLEKLTVKRTRNSDDLRKVPIPIVSQNVAGAISIGDVKAAVWMKRNVGALTLPRPG